MDVQDMTDLIYARDAYKGMNKSLHGEEMALEFHKGYLGAIGRISRVIERNVPEKWKKEDGSIMKILDTVLLSPEKRASLLLGEDKGSKLGEEEMPVQTNFKKN